MKNFISKIKEVKSLQNSYSFKDIGRKYCVKSFLGALFLSIVAIIPFCIVVVNILKIFSPVLLTFHITLCLICLLVYLFVPFTNMLYYAILKNYTQKEEIQQISLKYLFISELLNPFYLVLAIIFVLVIRYFIGQ